MRKAVVIVALAAPVLVLALLWMPQPHRAEPIVPQPTEAPAAQSAGRAATPGPPAPAPDPDTPARPEARPLAPTVEADPAVAVGAPPHPSSAEYAALLAARFDSDPPDVDSGLERDIARKVALLMPAGSRLDSIECRQMLCRLRSLHPDRAAYDAFIRDAVTEQEPEQRAWPGQTWIAAPSEHDDGAGSRLESVIYLQREPNPPPR